MDNCARENKNTALSAYLAWLVERGVFANIQISYLPVGHTHNECDQLASRLAVGVRYASLPTLPDFLEVLRGCVHPSPNVEVLNSVADTIGMLNPQRQPRWTGSKVYFFSGIMALESVLQDGEAPLEGVAKRHTTTLHFLLTLGPNSAGTLVPVFKTKIRYDTPHWSEVFFPFKHVPSGLSAKNIPPMRRKPLPAARMKELEANLEACSYRISPSEQAANQTELEQLKDTTPRPLHWPQDGQFERELEIRDEVADRYGDDQEGAELQSIVMPAAAPMASQHEIRKRRKRRKRGTSHACH
jgi:hypothetical protein